MNIIYLKKEAWLKQKQLKLQTANLKVSFIYIVKQAIFHASYFEGNCNRIM